ncbi:MAG: S1 RNA-binding domain-containing protein [Planctomycetaceae bacterium]|jgi:small subunit ribosomal protein S1|nr:S1 RNA-binding domain-containing protein [Planctomycetaceae bacterium]
MFSENEISDNVPVAVSNSNNTSNSNNDTSCEDSARDKSVAPSDIVTDDQTSDKSYNQTSDKLPNDLSDSSNSSDTKTSDVVSSSDAVASDSSTQPQTQPATPTKSSRPKRLIGSQRNPEAYRSQPTIKVVDTTPITLPVEESTPAAQSKQQPQNPTQDNNTDKSLQKRDYNQTAYFDKNSKLSKNKNNFDNRKKQFAQTTDSNTNGTNNNSVDKDDDDDVVSTNSDDLDKKILRELMVPVENRVEIPKLRGGKMSDDLEAEFDAVMSLGGVSDAAGSIDNLFNDASDLAGKEVIEAGTKMKAKVLAIRGDSLFLDLNVREQGVVLVNMFATDAVPKVGDEIEVTVGKLDIDEGLYEVTVPLAAADVRDWTQIQEGMIVEAKVTKSNSGGLECEVNRLRGFIPISQIDIFRVDNIDRYVGQKLTCIVEEVNPERRNLVVSRRAMINRERDEQKKQLLAELAPGQVKEGLVRKIIDGGVFVDLGGVDGFVPVSKLSWGRVRHPSDVLSEGKRIVVRIDKIEEGTNRISLTYRDDSSNPWSNIFEHFQEKTQARGKVVKITAFGAFIELMPGVDGLVLISELSNKHVNNVHEVLKEGEWVDVFIVSIDVETKRIKLSIRQLIPTEPEVVDVAQAESKNDADSNKTNSQSTDSKTQNNKKKQEGVAAPIKIKTTHKGPLKGGIGNNDGNSNIGLKW